MPIVCCKPFKGAVVFVGEDADVVVLLLFRVVALFAAVVGNVREFLYGIEL